MLTTSLAMTVIISQDKGAEDKLEQRRKGGRKVREKNGRNRNGVCRGSEESSSLWERKNECQVKERKQELVVF